MGFAVIQLTALSVVPEHLVDYVVAQTRLTLPRAARDLLATEDDQLDARIAAVPAGRLGDSFVALASAAGVILAGHTGAWGGDEAYAAALATPLNVPT
jgi:hypothetical protein